ncbi:2-hydroxyacid dehydrogenase [Variovorax sp. RB2P76]|uniref:2-hydroxyacid dehydrogenase n=1 Tax=Variovorax sp. RB2P76 TaxID=3443736 RepID=UPI003F448078
MAPHPHTLVFHSDFDSLDEWRTALGAALPGLPVLRTGDIEDPDSVRYALVWKPPQDFFARFRKLQLVVNLGAGVDSLVGRADLPEVPITRLSDPDMARMMAGYVLFAVMRHARDIVFFERAQREGRWAYKHPRSPESTRVGVLGLGELGSRAASELARQGFAVRGWSRSPRGIDGVDCRHGDAALPGFLDGCDILVVMLPLTPQTNRLIGAAQLALLLRGCCVVNVSRGQVIEQDALVAALQSGHVAEATLDVFEKEPLPPGHALWAMDNVLITPHLASVALPASAARQIADNIRRIDAGEDVAHRVDLSRGY